MDGDLQSELVKDGKIQREKIDDDVEKLLEAAQKGDVAKVTEILKTVAEVSELLHTKDAKKDFINEGDANRRNALHFSVHSGSLEITKLLISKGANKDAQDWEEYTALMYALKLNKEDIANYLLDNGASVDTLTEKGITPLHTAVMGRNEALLKHVLERKPKTIPNRKLESGSALHFAVAEPETIYAEILLQADPELVHTVDAHEMTPLHLACAYNNTNMALLLIEKGVDVNHASSDGTTALHIASETENIAIVSSLVSHGAVQKMDVSGHTPIMAASRSGNKELEILLKDLKIDYSAQKTPTEPTAKFEEKLSAEKLKNNGNEAFAKKDFDMALHWYNLALDVDSIYCEIQCRPTSIGHILFSNRAATQYHLKNYTEALSDAEQAIALAPSWPKGYMRKGVALEALGKKEDAEKAYAKQKELEAEEKK